jgi:hypothetical protein
MDLGIAGKRAVVTGASRGLGRAIAEELVREGVRVAMCARGEEDLLIAARDLEALGGEVYWQVADVTDPDQVRDFIGRSAEALGGIDFLPVAQHPPQAGPRPPGGGVLPAGRRGHPAGADGPAGRGGGGGGVPALRARHLHHRGLDRRGRRGRRPPPRALDPGAS